MKHSPSKEHIWWLVLAFFMVPVPGEAAVSPAEACRDRTALEARKFFGSTYKARQQCQDDVVRRRLPGATNCATESRAAFKINRAAAKLEAKIQGQCTDAQVAAGLFTSACESASTVDQLVECTREAHIDAVIAMLPEIGDLNLVEQTDAQKCRKTAATQFRKVADKRMKEAQKCQAVVDKGGLPAGTNCILRAEADPKLEKFEIRAEKKVAAVCGTGEGSPIARARFAAPCSEDDAGRFYPCARCNLSTITNDLLQTQGVSATESLRGLEPATGACIPRDTNQITRIQQSTANALGFSWELEFYRNTAYSCGLSGNYTFLVMNPAGNPDAEAPLWVYLHGGGGGYFDETGTYIAVKTQTQNTYNHEETFSDLWDDQIIRHTFNTNTNQPKDSTLKRRIEEGYRVLAVSMCDHDIYAGLGTPYTNNPLGGEVNGLQATMAAIDYTVANYPTTRVFAHGTSAGSIGVWALATAYPIEGRPLTAIVADSWIADPRIHTVSDAFRGNPGYPFGANMEPSGITEKVGYFAREDLLSYPEVKIVHPDFQDTPSLFIAGNDDPFCGGNQPLLAEAAAAGLTNCNWFHDGLRQAINGQSGSPHQLNVLTGFGHVPTNFPGPVNDTVDNFIAGILATNPPNFGSPTGAFLDRIKIIY